jgi:aspartate kinase
MQVYKFGGASIATPERMQALLPIIEMAEKPLAIVVSAYGKTTNALESIVKAAIERRPEEALERSKALEAKHNAFAAAVLGGETCAAACQKLDEFYTELHWAIADAGLQTKDYVYDQIVCIGEMLSSTIFSAFLKEKGISCQWLDARDLIRTDDTFRNAKVDEAFTEEQIKNRALPLLQAGETILTQGFIGATSYNASTTLGREGSDYTAALLAAMLPAGRVTIWKDVEGLLNADPKQFPLTRKIREITFHEVIEMAYYGAQVIHPKTIKPLQNANIPLIVKCFLNPAFEGTVIQNTSGHLSYPPLIVLKKDQVLLQMTSRDFSFITEDNISNIYQIFHAQGVKINLIQNAAISLVICIDHNEEKICALITGLEKEYKVLRNEALNLLTIRHYNTEILNELIQGKSIMLEQKTRQTLQLVYS